MEKHKLMPDEVVLMQTDEVEDTNSDLNTDDVILTNQNIIINRYSSKGFFKEVRTYNNKCIPLRNIQIRDGNAHLELRVKENKLDIYLNYGKETLWFTDKNDVKLWANGINKALTGQDIEYGKKSKEKTGKIVIPGTAFIAKALKDTTDTFKETFNASSVSNVIPAIDTSSHESIAAIITPKAISKTCMNCGAEVSGIQGSSVLCQYCRSEQEL